MNETSLHIEERSLFSAIILAGLCANYHNPVPSSFKVEDAVNLADCLIKILKKMSRKSKLSVSSGKSLLFFIRRFSLTDLKQKKTTIRRRAIIKFY